MMRKSSKFSVHASAIRMALEEIGGRTSIPELMEQANKYAVGSVTYGNCVAVRLSWRDANGQKGFDCRTNETQHRRNMFDDQQTSTPAWKSLAGIMKKSGVKALKSMLDQFHSIDQIRVFVNEIAELQAA